MAFNRVINHLNKCEKIVKSVSVNPNNVLNEVNNKCVKMCRISTECKALDRNQDKCKSNKHFICFWPKCRYSSVYRKYFEKHFLIHLNENNIECNECNKAFKTQSSLIEHKRVVHRNERRFVCPRSDCRKRFISSAHLKQHLTFHSNERHFKCVECYR